MRGIFITQIPPLFLDVVYTVCKRLLLDGKGSILMAVTYDVVAELVAALAALVAAIERVVSLVLSLAGA